MRKIGSAQWLKPSDFDKGDVMFEKARYVGSEEGQLDVKPP